MSNSPSTGKFISAAESKKRLDSYFEFVKSGKFPNDPHAKECPVGFYFGIDKVKELLKHIEGMSDVEGIRIYMARKGDLPDAFIVPVNKDGKDMYPVSDNPSVRKLNGDDQDDDDDGPLGDPLPCPNYCP